MKNRLESQSKKMEDITNSKRTDFNQNSNIGQNRGDAFPQSTHSECDSQENDRKVQFPTIKLAEDDSSAHIIAPLSQTSASINPECDEKPEKDTTSDNESKSEEANPQAHQIRTEKEEDKEDVA